MFKYIMMQWKHKKIILSLMVIGFFVGSLFLSVGASLVKENYNYILDCNSGDYSKQLNIDMKINEGLNIEKIKSIFQKLGKYGEIQILSLGGVETDNGVLQIVPVEAKNQGDWHIPIINGNYLDGQCGQVVLGKDAADALKSKKGKNVSINGKKYNVRGICGRENRETIWDNAIYMEFEDYISSFGNDFYNPQKKNNYIMVLKNGKDEFINEFGDIEQKLSNYGVEIVYEEMERNIDGSSLDNSIAITAIASCLVFFIAIINIINLMNYWMMERKKEIGIMKAMGALNGFIIKWVVVEMTMISSMGAILALFIQFVINVLFKPMLVSYGVNINLSFTNLLLAILVSALCGVISALLIVRKSVMFNPIEVISCE